MASENEEEILLKKWRAATSDTDPAPGPTHLNVTCRKCGRETYPAADQFADSDTIPGIGVIVEFVPNPTLRGVEERRARISERAEAVFERL